MARVPSVTVTNQKAGVAFFYVPMHETKHEPAVTHWESGAAGFCGDGPTAIAAPLRNRSRHSLNIVANLARALKE